MADRYDVVVVGAGLMGAAAAWSLARRGRAVLVVEQYELGHDLGSSHGTARIVRRAYGDALYTRLTGRAFELWRELELAATTPLLRMSGGLDFGPERDVPAVAAHLFDAGVPHEVLPAEEAARRWPGMAFEGSVLFHAQAGVLDADAAVRAFLAEAHAAGAVVRTSCAATSVDTGSVTLADGSVARAEVVVVAAGGWVSGLLGPATVLPPLRVTSQTFVQLPRRDPAADPWPTVIHDARGHAAYHLAGGGPDDDRKLGLHDAGADAVPGRPSSPDPGVIAWLIDYARDWLPGLMPEPSTVGTCRYTMTPSEHFVIDRVGALVICSPCSGHGAKFAPLIGEYVAGLACGEPDVPDRFRLAAHLAGHLGSVSL